MTSSEIKRSLGRISVLALLGIAVLGLAACADSTSAQAGDGAALSVAESDEQLEVQIREINDQILATHDGTDGDELEEGETDAAYELMLERKATCDEGVVEPLEEHSDFIEDFCSATLREAREEG